MLIGLVCKNAIMLVDYTNHEELPVKYQNGFDSSQPCSLRPILMTTTIAMVFGMFPIALVEQVPNGKRIGMGNHWWFDKFTIPYADYCSCNL
jgi:HAE1 family hydrophobic/amphiphilic exporter-1